MRWLTAIFFFMYGQVALAQLPAFPGAEGAGKYATGGRGTATIPTTVFEVSRLEDDNNPGSLRYALSQTATYRTIVFRVSGTIHLNSKLFIRANTTVAGQTAPGDGITLADYPVAISGDNVIVRYLRFRMGDKNQNAGMVDGSGSDDAFGNTGNKNIMVDHCTASWSTDEAMSIYRGDSVTIQWCLLSEPLNYSYHSESGDTDWEQHGYGGIWGGRHASFHHNLLAHAKGRMPRFDGSRNLPPGTAGQENGDYRNNVIYNWGSYNVNGGEGGNYNLVNNYYKYGPSTGSGSSAGVPQRYMIMNPYKTSSLPYPKLFVQGNYVDGSATITANNWRGIAMNGGSLADTLQSKVSSPFAIMEMPTQPAEEAYDLVLAHSGTSLPNRDTLDERIVNDVRNRTGRIIDVQGGYLHGTPYEQTVNAWPALNSTTPPADADHDGMPDEWETEQGLNPNDASDRNTIGANGYTQLENYLNSLAQDAMIIKGGFQNFSQVLGAPSAIQTYWLTGKHLTGDIQIVAPAGFEISTDGNTWHRGNDSLTLVASNGEVASTQISVRLNAASTGSFNGPVRHVSRVGAVVALSLNGTTSAATAIPDVSFQKQFSAYPNPVRNTLFIKHPAATKDMLFTVYDTNGKQVLTCKPVYGQTTSPIPVSQLAGGAYVIELRSGSKKAVLKFIVSK